MPLIKRAEESILRLEPIVDFIVNPCAHGTMAAGLALAMREHFGEEMFEDYRRQCLDGKLKLGQLHVWKDKKTGVSLINIPTKEHFANPTEIEIIKRSLRSLRDHFKENRYWTAVMPMIGGGHGQLPIEEAEPLNQEYLGDLPNIFHISMLPKAFEKIPRYLGVSGSRVLDDKVYIKERVLAAIDKWGLEPSDFDGIISGGATRGVDVYICGRSIEDETYKTSLAAELGIPAYIAEADWDRYGRTAGFKRNHTIIDVATHFVALLDERDKRSAGTRQAMSIVKSYNEKHPDAKKFTAAFSYQGPKS